MLNIIKITIWSITVAALVALIIAAVMGLHEAQTEANRRQFDERFDLPHGWFAFAHQYHGCFHSYWSEERNAWVFRREGKECLLFTESLRNVILDRFNINEEQRRWLEEK